MKHYLFLASKYQSVHKKKTRLAIASVVMAVALVSGIFSMMDALIKFEKRHVLETEGNYHILIRNPSEEEIQTIKSRIDVKNSGTLKDLGEGKINNLECVFGSLNENFASNLNFELTEGSYPTKKNEIMLEKWFMEQSNSLLSIGDTVKLCLPGDREGQFVITGTYKDWGVTKAVGIPIVFLSVSQSNDMTPVSSQYFILFKDKVNIMHSEDEITNTLRITDKRIGRNERLLAYMLQSKNSTVLQLYMIGVFLFTLVLITAVVMIYNTFNISVLERIRQFGILQCLGASKSQIRKLVRREGILISIKAIPIGLIFGIIMRVACSAILKYNNSNIYGDIPLIDFSILGIGTGIIVGLLTVILASLSPARRAAKISPISALSGSSEYKNTKKRKWGALTKLLRVEGAIGINNAIKKKKAFILMTSSIALSIIMFLCFSFLVNPNYLGMKAVDSNSPDIAISSEDGIDNKVYSTLMNLEGTKRIAGRMTGYINATFEASKLTDEYRKLAGEVKVGNNGLFSGTDKSWLISYDNAQLKRINGKLESGTSDQDSLNAKNGIIVVEKIKYKKKNINVAKFHLGDKIYIKTVDGMKEYEILGILDSVSYSSKETTMSIFITTEELFTEITGESEYNVIDLQLKSKNQEQNIQIIKDMLDDKMKFHDWRQFNSEARNTFMTIAVFIYGFVGIIALISILNIINTMNTSVASKTRYLGVMRAIGMTGKQLSVMIFTEALVYCISGCLTGCLLGSILQKAMSNVLKVQWKLPILQIVLISLFCILTALISIQGPLFRMRKKRISELMTSP